MKTNESDTPWDPKPELDQKDDGKLHKAGLDQLDRDVLRFLELVPDIQMAKVKIATNVAFPLAPKPASHPNNSHCDPACLTPIGAQDQPPIPATRSVTQRVCPPLEHKTSLPS